MGIYGAMSTAISGLQAQSYALENISGNIANVQTSGYKRRDTSFSELVPDSSNAYRASSVRATGRQTLNVQGDIAQSSIGTFMAISGDGFFSVRAPDGTTDGELNFDGRDLYTRRGDFDFDRQGYLVNGAGYYLMGLSIDQDTGEVSGNELEPIKIDADYLAAKRTSKVTLHANIPADPDRALLDSALTADDVIDESEETEFMENSLSGGSITVRDENGQPVNLQMRWAKTAADDGTNKDTWTLFYMSDSSEDATEWTKAGDFEFNSDGSFAGSSNSLDITGVTVDGVTVGDVTLQHDKAITQYADDGGTVETTELTQNGYAAGELIDVGISESGRVTASYSNGQTIDLYEIPLASFNAPNKLKALDGGAFSVTMESGEAMLGASGSIMGAALEGSNTDIADEFTKLIVTQQAYSAGTRIITTSDEMMQEALNMKR